MPPPSNDTIREIVKILRRHVDAATLEKVVNELLDIPGNRDFSERYRGAGARVNAAVTREQSRINHA